MHVDGWHAVLLPSNTAPQVASADLEQAQACGGEATLKPQRSIRFVFASQVISQQELS